MPSQNPFLIAASALYGTGVSFRNYLFDKGIRPQFRLPVPVISVGNLSVGGSGKTPLSEWIMSYLAAKGLRVAYLSRGYGRQSRGYLRVDPLRNTAAEVGDEALQVARKFPALPIAVCASRVEGGQRLIAEAGAQVIVLDDAFQHRSIYRDLDLVLTDASRLPGEDRVLPAGRLRESTEGIKRADALIVNKLTDLSEIPLIREKLSTYGKPILFVQGTFEHLRDSEGKQLSLQSIEGQEIALFAGIGNPRFFAQQVAAAGAKITHRFFYPDHYAYPSEELRRMQMEAGKALLLTTEKDACRLQGSAPPEFRYAWLEMRLSFLSGEDWLSQRLDQLCAL